MYAVAQMSPVSEGGKEMRDEGRKLHAGSGIMNTGGNGKRHCGEIEGTRGVGHGVGPTT